ncbi:hypothetical protein Tco_0387436 [Tanacetum coccineum]
MLRSCWKLLKRYFGWEWQLRRKTQRTLFKATNENFTTPSSEMLDQTFDRLQKLVSQLELLDEKLSQEDVNQNQPNSPQLVHENLQKFIHKDIEEWDLRMANGHVDYEGKKIFEEYRKEAYCLIQVPPPYTGNFMPPTFDLSFTGLDEFFNKSVVENCKVMYSEEEPMGNPQMDLQDQGIEDILLLEGTPKEGKSQEKKSQVLLRVPRKNNMYSVDLKNIVPKGGLTCLFAKATSDESKLWHRRLGTQSNGFAGTKAINNAGQARKEIVPAKDYILLPLWTANPPSSQDPKSSHDDGSNLQQLTMLILYISTVNVAGTNEVNAVGVKTSIELPFDPNMHVLEDDSIFYFSRDDEDDSVVTNINNLDTTIKVSPIPTTRIHKDHPLDQLIEICNTSTQTRKIVKEFREHGIGSMEGKLTKRPLSSKGHKGDICCPSLCDDIIFGSTKKEPMHALEKLIA